MHVNAMAPSEPSLAAALDADKTALLARLADGMAPAELYWVAAWSAAQAAQVLRGGQSIPVSAGPMNAGLNSAGAVSPVASIAATDVRPLTVVYGSQTGNARRIAEQLASRGEAAGLPVRLLRADAYPLRELVQERHLIVVISTQGDGEPPDDSRAFVEFVAGRRAPKLPGLQFAVLGLGDSSYPQFCAIGRQLDSRLAELGGTRFAPAGEADVDVETIAGPWANKALEQAREAFKLPASPSPSRVTALHAVPRSAHSREQPFAATVLANQRIVSRDSARDVRHVELSLEGSGLSYEPGDAVGVWPRNPPALVEQWLAALRLDGAQEVEHAGRHLPLAQWLLREREITRLNRTLVAAHAAASGDRDLAGMLLPEQAPTLAALLDTHQPIDMFRRYPAGWQADELIAALRPLAPRLYSIASSARAVGRDEVHLTVALVDYEAHGQRHWGAASAFLAEAAEDARVPVYIEANERFRLPADPARDIIMIGPGTGIAPFRAFVQERREIGAGGRQWLFSGNRHFTQDFLYQLEWQAALKAGVLHRLDLAFSRDQASKTYVQHRLREQGRELYAWLKEGAHLYVCGDSAHMARDVHAALIDVVATHGAQSIDAAKAFLADLLQQGRYARDVY